MYACTWSGPNQEDATEETGMRKEHLPYACIGNKCMRGIPATCCIVKWQAEVMLAREEYATGS